MHRNYAEKGCHLYPVVEHTSDLNNVVTATSDLRAERRKCHSTLSVFFFFPVHLRQWILQHLCLGFSGLFVLVHRVKSGFRDVTYLPFPLHLSFRIRKNKCLLLPSCRLGKHTSSFSKVSPIQSHVCLSLQTEIWVWTCRIFRPLLPEAFCFPLWLHAGTPSL